ncbi:uncharacterized protein PRCAT00003006001 [Priceomyces carsonii]|uniref:uncharacterized protein n=1 Tax=Priceomyces carsonii TaxID=28549 RepID=UPI002ED7AD2C|nr:unnamed protein product [Priceomyces carsonii]
MTNHNITRFLSCYNSKCDFYAKPGELLFSYDILGSSGVNFTAYNDYKIVPTTRKTSGAATNSSSSTLWKILVSFILLSTFMNPVLVIESKGVYNLDPILDLDLSDFSIIDLDKRDITYSSDEVLEFQNIDLSEEQEQKLGSIVSSLPVGSNYSYLNGTVEGRYLGSSVETPSDGLSKRLDCITLNYKEKRIYKRGNWWSSWEPIGDCLCNRYGDEAEIVDSYAYTRSATWETGAELSFGLNWINSHMSYSVSKSYTYGTEMHCGIKSPDWAIAIWAQTRYVWMDTQQRIKHVPAGACGNWKTTYSGWGTTRRVNVPVSKNGNDFRKKNEGCSKNEKAGCGC